MHDRLDDAPTSAHLVREASDRRVVEAMLEGGASTRVALANKTGLSRPTVSAAVARLIDAGVLVETGDKTQGRGRSAQLLDFAHPVESLCVSVEPDGVRAEVVDAQGHVVRNTELHVTEQLEDALRAVAASVTGTQSFSHACVSVADPIDRTTGRAISLPDEPFLVGELDAARALFGLADDVQVDNDINWAVQAYAHEMGQDSSCAAVLYLGHGLGSAVMNDGGVLRGQSGLAGEVAHLCVPGVDGRAREAIRVFDDLGLRRGNAIDVEKVRVEITNPEVRAVLADVVSSLVAALVGIADPSVIVLSGPWSNEVFAEVVERVERAKRPVPVVADADSMASPQLGLRLRAATLARESVLQSIQRT